MATTTPDDAAVLTGRCYCGKTRLRATRRPQTVAYCHCSDCRRWTSAPVAAFAAFDEAAVVFTPNEGSQVSVNPGATRTFCASCGSPLTGRYDYLPGQVYIGVSIFDQASELVPKLHTHESHRLTWLHITDDLPRVASTGRVNLNKESNFLKTLEASITLVAENDIALAAWFGFCVATLDGTLSMALASGNIFLEDDGVTFYHLISLPIVVLWFVVVAMGLPLSMYGIPFYRCLKFFCWGPPNRSPTVVGLFFARLAVLLSVEVGIWAYIKHVDQATPYRTPLSEVVDFMEAVPEMWKDALSSTASCLGWIIMTCAILYSAFSMFERLSNNTNE